MGSTHNLADDQARTGQKLVVHARVDDLDFDPTMPGQDVDRGAATEKIEHHLVSDFARIGAHAFAGYSVVGCGYVYPLLLNTGRDRFSDGGDSSPNLLDVSKTTGRLGQA